MNKTAIKIIQLLIHAPATVSAVAASLGLSASAVSQVTDTLEKSRIVTKERVGVGVIIKLSNSPLSKEIIKIKDKFSVERLLGDSNEFVLVHLGKEKSFDELLEKTNLSVVQLYRNLVELQEIGAIKKENRKFAAVNELLNLIPLLHNLHELLDVEIGSVVLFSDNYKLKKAPADFPLSGTPTAFSVFSKYGVECISPYNYAIWPEKSLKIEEIFIHALKCSENKKDILLCMIFYLKNKRKIDMHECRNAAKLFSVTDLLLDVLSYLDNRAVKDASLFLPWDEFKEKAAVYGIKVKEKYKLEKLEALLSEFGRNVGKPITVYLIGGCNLSLRGIKVTTKDIDLIVRDSRVFRAVIRELKGMGFRGVLSVSKEYKKMRPSQILEKPGFPRIDVFTGQVCDALMLNDSMVDRSHTLVYGNLTVGLIRLEDIILFKAITEREGDLEDVRDIIRTEQIDWDIVFQEMLAQEKATKKTFCFDVLDSFELLKDHYGMKIGILKKLSSHCLEQGIMIALEKPRSVKEIKALIDFSETMIRNALVSLLKKKKIKKIKGKPVRFLRV